MTFRYIAHVHEVQPRIDVRRHPAAHEVPHNLPCGSGLFIARTYWRCRTNSNDRRALQCHLPNDAFGLKLGAFVRTGHHFWSGHIAFGGKAVAGEGSPSHSAGVHNPLDTRRKRHVHYVLRAIHIHLTHHLCPGRIKRVHRGQVDDSPASLQSRAERLCVSNISPDGHNRTRRRPVRAILPHESHNLVASSGGGFNNVAADEAGRACY